MFYAIVKIGTNYFKTATKTFTRQIQISHTELLAENVFEEPLGWFPGDEDIFQQWWLKDCSLKHLYMGFNRYLELPVNSAWRRLHKASSLKTR